jgi:hypothetical protein
VCRGHRACGEGGGSQFRQRTFGSAINAGVRARSLTTQDSNASASVVFDAMRFRTGAAAQIAQLKKLNDQQK